MRTQLAVGLALCWCLNLAGAVCAAEGKEQTAPAPATAAGKLQATPETPTSTLTRNIDELRSTLVAFKQRQGATTEQRNEEVRKKVRLLLNYERLGKMSLGRYYKKVSAAQVKEFQGLFRSLIERSYLAKLDSLVTDYTMKWGSEAVKGGEATVLSSVVRENADVQIKYFMEKGKERWMVYNIVFDDLDLARNYQTQFNKIIQDKGMKELLRKMKTKLSSGEGQL